MSILLYNGKIYEEKGSFHEAVLIEDGVIKDLGTNQDLKKKYPQAQKQDLEGKTVIPGLNDSHMHFMQMGETMNQVDIEGVPSIDDMVARCRAFIKENPDRVKNGLHALGWNQDLFVDSDRLPDRHDLDKISTEIPIVLERVCGHIVSTNTLLIEMLLEDQPEEDFVGGEYRQEADGYPSGIFTGNGCNYAKDVIPDFSLEERRDIILETMDYAVSLGLTSVQSNDVGTTFMDGPAAFKLYRDIYDSGQGLLRYRHQVCFNDLDDFKTYIDEGEFATNPYTDDSWLTLGPLKLFKDGSLGARTALMKNDYNDDPGNRGLEWTSNEDMQAYLDLALENNIQVVTHAIGDQAVQDVVDNYKGAFVNGENKLRHGLVHCQITDRPLLEEIAENDIYVFAQPIFLDYDMNIVESRCSEDLTATSYAFKTLKDLGAHVSYGTDSPVESCNPFVNIYMAVTRKDRAGKPEGGFYPDEAVDIYEAVDAYTLESAYMEFMEDKKGRIKECYYADLVVLDRDIFSVDPMEIKDILPLMTMVGGKVVYSKN